MKEEAKRKREWEELQKCTFKPDLKKQITRPPKTATLSLIDDMPQETPQTTESDEKQFAGYEAAQRLYARRKNQREKTEKTREDYEFEKYGQECTFAPKLNKQSHAPSFKKTSKPSERQQETFNKQLERQKKAREEKERIKQLMERGVPASTKPTLPRPLPRAREEV